MRKVPWAAFAATALAGAASLAATVSNGAEQPRFAASYDDQGRMLFPADYRGWVFLSAGRGMNYNPAAQSQPDPAFDNVFVDRASWKEFLATGTWPDGTTLVLEIRGGTSHGSILKDGSFQTGAPLAVEVHVKDTARFGGDGWAFFGFHPDDDPQPAKMIDKGADCYACHAANTAVDHTFVQFYPTLLPIARAKGTLSAKFLAAEAAEKQGGAE